MSAVAVEPEPEPDSPADQTAWSPLLLLVAASGWTVNAHTTAGGVEVTGRKDGATIRAVGPTAADCALPIFQEAMRNRGVA